MGDMCTDNVTLALVDLMYAGKMKILTNDCCRWRVHKPPRSVYGACLWLYCDFSGSYGITL